jgi:hypothetical protein
MTPAPATAVRPARRPGPAAPRRAPESTPARPHLRVVDPNRLTRRARRRRARIVMVAATVVACASLFGLAAFHAMLVEGQVRLDQLEGRVADEQARYQRLRLTAAQLESPERIVAVAQSRLGMVPPPGVTYLSPSGAVADQVLAAEREVDDGTDPTDGRGDQAAAGRPGSTERGWATIKPYLGGRG